MSYDFNVNDILEMAEQIEENGAVFYNQAADSIIEGRTKSFLVNLADMEKKHKDIFSNMRANLTEKEKADTVFDPQGDTASYLKALADVRVFFEKKNDVSNIKSILKEAVIAEKDSIAFYVGMKKLVPENMGKNKIDQIINEEMRHIKLLSDYLKTTEL